MLDEIAQDLRQMLWRALELWEPERGAVSTYAYRAFWRVARQSADRARADRKGYWGGRKRPRTRVFSDVDRAEVAAALRALRPARTPAVWAAADAPAVAGELLRGLPLRHAVVLRMRYGLGAAAPASLEGIGAALGVGKERTRQPQNAGLKDARRAALHVYGDDAPFLGGYRPAAQRDRKLPPMPPVPRSAPTPKAAYAARLEGA